MYPTSNLPVETKSWGVDMSSLTNKVETTLTGYKAVEKPPENPQKTDNITNKKRKTISGEDPKSKKHTPNTNQGIQHPPITLESALDKTLEETDWNNLCEEDKHLMRLEKRLETKMKESIKESVKESMQEIVDNSLSKAMGKMTDAVNELIKTNQAVVTQQTAMHALEYENKTLNCRVQKLEYEQNKLKTKLDNIEHKGLECSVIIRGIIETMNKDTSSLMEQVYKELSKTIDAHSDWEKLKLAKEMDLVKCRWIERPLPGTSRPISVEFQYQQDMDYILGNKTYLHKGIYVDKEYTPKIECCRRLLRPILRAARNITEFENSCRMEEDWLVINGKHSTLENLDQLPSKLNVFNISSRSNETTIGFFGELNPLSNFHKVNFLCDNIQYHSSEQYIQHHNADYFRDRITSNKILNSTSALECKQLSSNIRNYDKRQWEKVAKEQCKPGIKCKFAQNPGLSDILLKCTENKHIVESTTDRFWGTGIPLVSNDCLDNRKWISPGLLGEILEEICSELASTDSPANDQNLPSNPLPLHPSCHDDNSMDTSSSDTKVASRFTGLQAETIQSNRH